MRMCAMAAFWLASNLMPAGPAGAQPAEDVRRIDRENLLGIIHNSGPVVVVDVRNIEAYLYGHIPGAVSLPFNRISEAAWPKNTPLVVYCLSAACHLSHDSALSLMRMGYQDVRDYHGGMREWDGNGLPVARGADSGSIKQLEDGPNALATIQPKELWSRINPHPQGDCGGCVNDGGGITVLDLRQPDKFGAGHLPGARNIPLEQLAQSTGTLSRIGDIVVYDEVPARGRLAAAVLQAAKLHVRILDGGISGWGDRPLDKGAPH